jgi:O-antigen/teichoic acid export membrane protein
MSFASMLVLVRFVDPKAFGLVALAFTALFVLQTLQDSGMGSALIHRREDLEEAAATVLVFSALTGVALYAVAFFAAPYASTLFHVHGLTGVLRVLALMLPIRSFSTVPSALLERAVDFRPRTVSDLVAAATQGGVSIALALLGAGVWALVLGQVLASAVSGVALWILSPARPDPRRASRRMARELLRYGRYITGGNLFMIASTSMDNVVVARLLGATLLGFYSVAFRLTELPVLVIGSIVGRVMFPIYSMMRDDVATVRRAYIQNLQRVALLSLPISVGMAAGARPLVRVLLGARWLPSVSALQVLAIFAVVRALLGPAGELYKGMGKPQYNVITGLVYVPIALPLLLVLADAKGTLGAALAVLIATACTGIVTMTLVFRLLDLRPVELFKALAPFLLSAALVAGAVELTVRITNGMPPTASLALVIGAGGVAFVVGTALFARPIVAQMWSSLKLSRGPEELPIGPAPV